MTKPKIITITTDFGEDFARGQLETVIYGINPNIKVITLSNQVTPFSLIEGAFILLKGYCFSPANSVHLAIIDPGVGSDRRGLIIRTRSHWLIGPDNGVLYPAALKDGIRKAYLIDEKKLGEGLSNTFHGRDIFAKVAAWICSNNDPLKFSSEINTKLLKKSRLLPNQVTHIDTYGNIKVNNSCQKFKVGNELRININNQEYCIPFVKIFANVRSGQLLAYYGSHNILEIAKNLGSANNELNLKIGDILQISKYNKPASLGLNK